MTSKVDRVARLLFHFESGAMEALEMGTNLTFDDVAAVPGWQIMRGQGKADTGTWYVTTPTQPRDPRVRHAVPPFEHIFNSRAELIAFLAQRWTPDARGFIAMQRFQIPPEMIAPAQGSRGEPSMRIEPVQINGAAVDKAAEITREVLDVAARRWALGAGHTWHRVGAVPAPLLDLGHTREAPPTGSRICEDCLLRGSHVRDDDGSGPER